MTKFNANDLKQFRPNNAPRAKRISKRFFTPEIKWVKALEPCGDEKVWGRLLGVVEIGGTLHHVEAIEVEDVDGAQQGVLDSSETVIDLAFQLTDGPMETVEIYDRQYAVIVHPFQR